MYIAMNRFKVRLGEEPAFENVWRSRESRLQEMAGFVSFDLLRGTRTQAHTLYVSYTVWATQDAFTHWTESQQFQDAHKSAGQGKPLTVGPPAFEGFEPVVGLAVPARV